MSTEGLVTFAIVHKLRLLTETGKYAHLEAMSIDNVAISDREHFLARIVDLLDSTVIEFKKFALERYNDVLLAILLIDLVQLGLVASRRPWLLDVWILAAEEVLEDLVVKTLVSVAGKLVLALRNAILKTVLTILVIHTLHERVREHFVGLADARESLVSLSFLLTRASHWVVAQGKLAEGLSNLLTVGRWVDLKRFVIPCLVVVHL